MSKSKSIIYKQKAAGVSTPPNFPPAFSGGPAGHDDLNVPSALNVLDDWLARFEPADSVDDGQVELRTTVDIINDLSSMCDLDIRGVVAHMTRKGYRSYHDSDGVHGWMLKRVDRR